MSKNGKLPSKPCPKCKGNGCADCNGSGTKS